MEIGHAVSALLQPRGNFLRQSRIGAGVKENGASRTDKRPRPAENNDSRDQAHQRVHPDPTELPARNQADDDQHRNRGVRSYMNEGSAQVVIAVVAVMPVIVGMIVAAGMVMIVPQKKSTEQIDA